MISPLPPVGFWSYAHHDLENSKLSLVELRDELENSLRSTFKHQQTRLWQDSGRLNDGDDWRKEIQQAIEESSFIVLVLTPAFLRSPECCAEVIWFVEREKKLGRSDLIFPIHFEDTDHLDPASIGDMFNPEVFSILKSRNFLDFRDERSLGTELSSQIDKLVKNVQQKLLGNENAEKPFEVQSTVLGSQPRATFPRPGSTRANLAEWLEKFAEKTEILNVFVTFELLGLGLLFTAYLLSVGYVVDQETGKQVGMLYAPNWSVMYTVLFPLYNMLFCSIVERTRSILNTFYDRGVLRNQDGRAVDPKVLGQSWGKHLRIISKSLWLLAISIILISAGQWYKECYSILVGSSPLTRPFDWGLTTLQYPSLISLETQIGFTALAYLYMAFALWVYLSVLTYIPTFCRYLRKMSVKTGDLRILLRGNSFQRETEKLIWLMFLCTFLGLLSAYLMRLQSLYRLSSYETVFQFLVSGDNSVFNFLFGKNATGRELSGMQLASSWSSLLVALVAVVAFALTILFLRETFNNSRDYLQIKLSDAEWCSRAQISLDETKLSQLSGARFVPTVVPQIWLYAAIIVTMISAILFPNYPELLLSGGVMYAVRVMYVAGHLGKSKGLADRENDLV